MIDYYARHAKEQSFKAYQAECESDIRLTIIQVVSAILGLAIILIGALLYPVAFFAAPPLGYVVVICRRRVLKSIKNQYLYL